MEGKVACFLHPSWAAHGKQSARSRVQVLQLLATALSWILLVVMEHEVVAVTVKRTGDNLQEITFFRVLGGFGKRFLI